jgi:PAS domain S-box-containing protein
MHAVGSLPRPFLMVLAFALLAAIFIVDILTGPEILLSVFYILPVALASWFVGSRAGLVMAFFSTLAWLGDDVYKGAGYSHFLIPYWNSLVRWGLFMIAVYAFSELKNALANSSRLAFLVESSNDAIIGKTLEGTIVTWNKGAERLYGYSAAEATGRPVSMLIPQEKPDELPTIISRVMGGETIEHYEAVRVRKDSERVSVSLSISPIRDEQDNITGISSIARDITREKALERMREKFLSILGHDLKSPLTSLTGFAEILTDTRFGEISADKLEYAQIIRKLGEVLHIQINNILGIARMELGRMNYEPGEHLLEEILRDLFNDFKLQAEFRMVGLEFSCPGELWIRADRVRLTQVIHNLLENALRRTHSRRTIRVSSRLENGRVEIEVSDDGSGFSEAERKKISDMFLEGGHAGTEAELGLYIASEFLREYGSPISLESGPRGGARFSFTLEAASDRAGKSHPGMRLMLVGNNGAIPLASRILEEEGHRTRHVPEDGGLLGEALSYKPEVILLFEPLAELSSKEAGKILKGDPDTCQIPVIVLSPDSKAENGGGFASVIGLPFDPEALKETVSRVGGTVYLVQPCPEK